MSFWDRRDLGNLLLTGTSLGITYNALPGQRLQTAFQDWAKKRYSDTWAVLNKKGRRVNEFSLCQFKINRVMKA